MPNALPTPRPGFEHLVGEIEGEALRHALSALGLDPVRVATFLSENSQSTLAHLTLAYTKLVFDSDRASADGLSPGTVHELAIALKKLRHQDGASS